MNVMDSLGKGFKATLSGLGGLRRPLIGGVIIAGVIVAELLIIKSFGFDVTQLPFGAAKMDAGGIAYLLAAGMMLFHLFGYMRKEPLQGMALVERGWVYGIFIWFLISVLGTFSKDILAYGITSVSLMTGINVSLISMIALGIIVAILHEKIK